MNKLQEKTYNLIKDHFRNVARGDAWDKYQYMVGYLQALTDTNKLTGKEASEIDIQLFKELLSESLTAPFETRESYE